MTLKLRKVRVPADGSCFFHAIGHQCGLTALQLRNICYESILARAKEDFNGLTLETWIQFEKGMTVEAYARSIQTTLWGGLVEMKLLSDYLKRPVVVYAEDGPRRAQKIMVVETDGDPVYLLFRGRHYDAMVREVEK